MKSSPESKTKLVVYSSIAGLALLIAAYLYFFGGGESKPDAATQAAAERTNQMEANVKQPPPTPDLPVSARAPRGAAKGN